jgi:hypothetical protein
LSQFAPPFVAISLPVQLLEFVSRFSISLIAGYASKPSRTVAVMAEDASPVTGLDELEAHLQELLEAPGTPLQEELLDEVSLQLTGMSILLGGESGAVVFGPSFCDAVCFATTLFTSKFTR